MRRISRISPIATIILAILLVTACSDRENSTLQLPETPALVGQGSYALVTEAYARFHHGPEIMESVIAHGRSGDVLEVIGTTADRRWTKLQTPAGPGWVQSIHIRRFSNRQQAINARRLFEE